MMLQGMTARYLLRGCYDVKKGDTILIHAAAGGVGSIVCQWAKHLGATVIGTVGSPAKAELARAHGCDHPILYNDEDFTARTKEITGGNGVDVAYDSVGAGHLHAISGLPAPHGHDGFLRPVFGIGPPLRPWRACSPGFPIFDPAELDGLYRRAGGFVESCRGFV